MGQLYAGVDNILVPVLRPGDIIVLDNLGAHKNEQTLALIRDARAEVRFLPAFSPDLNPIEMMWSKVKALLRKAQARNLPDLLKAIASSLAAVSSQDALGWFVACGYSFIRNALAVVNEQNMLLARNGVCSEHGAETADQLDVQVARRSVIREE